MENILPDNLIRLSDSALCYIESSANGRSKNDDSFALFELTPFPGQPPIVFLAVADGMDSHDSGEQISRETLRSFARALYEQFAIDPAINSCKPPAPLTPTMVAGGMIDAVRRANSEVLQTAHQNGWDKAGATLTAVAIMGNQAVVIGIGDSPLYHYSSADGEIKALTESHNVAAILVRAGLITPEMARHHEGRAHLEFYVGKAELPIKLSVPTITLQPGDKILLCSDSVSASTSESRLAEILQERGGLPEITRRLMEEARSEGETDNQTVILCQFEPTLLRGVRPEQYQMATPAAVAHDWTDPGREHAAEPVTASAAILSEQQPVPHAGQSSVHLDTETPAESEISARQSGAADLGAAGREEHAPAGDAGAEHAPGMELATQELPPPLEPHGVPVLELNTRDDKDLAAPPGIISLDQYERATVSSEQSVDRRSKLSGNPLSRIMQIMGLSRPELYEPAEDDDYRIDEERKK